MDYKKQNEILRTKLQFLQKMYIREVKAHQREIAKKQSFLSGKKEKDVFLGENIEEILFGELQKYFGEQVVMSFPNGFFEQLVSSELLFYSLRNFKKADGFSVVAGYHKMIDILVEENITKPFRFFANTKKRQRTTNDVQEKNLEAVLKKGYIFSFGKLYQILSDIQAGKELGMLGATFQEFLESYHYIGKVVLSEKFLHVLKVLVESGTFGEKRHSGMISYEETKKIRFLILGDLKNQDSLLYYLASFAELPV